MRTAVVIVTHNGERYLMDQLDSIEAQSALPDEIVVVDDRSVDKTRMILDEYRQRSSIPMTLLTSEAATDLPVHTRVGFNFMQGVRATNADVVLFADQDDVWLRERVAMQTEVFRRRPSLSVVAHDGLIIDSSSNPSGETLRTTFPVPKNWWELLHDQRIRFVMRYPVGTGAAMAIQPSCLGELELPPSWLHDRWLTLLAVASDQLDLVSAPVIKYRVHERQAVGLSGSVRGPRALLKGLVRKPSLVVQKLLDESRLGHSLPFPAAKNLTLPLSVAVMSGLLSAKDKAKWDLS